MACGERTSLVCGRDRMYTMGVLLGDGRTVSDRPQATTGDSLSLTVEPRPDRSPPVRRLVAILPVVVMVMTTLLPAELGHAIVFAGPSPVEERVSGAPEGSAFATDTATTESTPSSTDEGGARDLGAQIPTPGPHPGGPPTANDQPAPETPSPADIGRAEAQGDGRDASEAPPAIPRGQSRLFARHDATSLLTPSPDPVRIGFHEASYRVALGMIPLGRPLGNDNTGKYEAPPVTTTEQDYMVMSSRSRPTPAVSAADIVMRPGEPVRAVVDGTVVESKPYRLYGKYPDTRVRIRSEEGKIVTMLHVTGSRVEAGQQVRAGETVVADTATSFPFLSQIDHYLGDTPRPHVHIEIKRG